MIRPMISCTITLACWYALKTVLKNQTIEGCFAASSSKPVRVVEKRLNGRAKARLDGE